ncbi:MAG TPA: alpha/beta fold hydrolase, partial [Candidatus Dormibacteraeota bacterium]|nr:alpha/beta fold hydrolase [Candidatus Dormibacteraeota bacterium]
RRALGTVAGAAVGVYALYLGGLFFLQDRFIYPGRSIPVAPQAPSAAGVEVLKLAIPGGTVEALLLPATAESAAAPTPVMIFAHGNGEVIDYWVKSLDGFRELGIAVLLVEYPGYGRSVGSPSEVSVRAALAAAYDRIAADPRVDRTRIFGFGMSLGGGAICALASERPLRALILQSTFTSLDSFTQHFFAPAFLLRSHFNNLATVTRFPGPVLVIHGRSDGIIPWQQGARLAAAAAHSTFRLYECAHVCWDPERLPFWRDATDVLVSAGILAPGEDSNARRRLSDDPRNATATDTVVPSGAGAR